MASPLQTYQLNYYCPMNDLVDNKILKKYEIVKKIGKGAYGQVWKAINKKTKRICALKKVFDAFRNTTDCQRTYREIMYLKELDHPNIIKLLDYSKSTTEKDVYIEMEFIESDLATTIKSGCLKGIQKEYIFAQIVSAVEYLHSGDLIHRDIKPSNILIGGSCEAKLCDFGLIRSVGETDINLTDNIATRWYKAPQLLLSSNNYGKEVDIWSLGCILGEMYLGKPIFAGASTFNQLQKIIQVTGKPMHNVSTFIQSQTSLAVLNSFHYPQKNKTVQEIYPSMDPLVCDLLAKIFQFDPKNRPTLKSLIEHPYFDKYRSKVLFKAMKDSIKLANDKIDQKKLTITQYKKLLTNPTDIETEKKEDAALSVSPNYKTQSQNALGFKAELGQMNSYKQFPVKNGVKDQNNTKKEVSVKEKAQNKLANNRRQDRQNISPDSEYSGNSNHNKSVKSNTSKIIVSRKMVSPTNKSTKSAKIGTNTPNRVDIVRKKNILEVNDKQKMVKKDKDGLSDLSCGNPPRKIEVSNKISSNSKPNYNAGKSFPTTPKNLTPQAKIQPSNPISSSFKSPNIQSSSILSKQRISNNDKELSHSKMAPDSKIQSSILSSPSLSSQTSPQTSQSGYKFLTRNTNEPMRPTVVKHSGATIYKPGFFRQS